MKDRENRTIDAILIVNRCYRFIYKAFIVFGCKVSKKNLYIEAIFRKLQTKHLQKLLGTFIQQLFKLLNRRNNLQIICTGHIDERLTVILLQQSQQRVPKA